MKKKLKRHFSITSLISIATYLISSFVAWDLTVITKIPEIEPEYRAVIAILVFFMHGIVASFIFDEKNKTQ